jgi:hypothetical protein
MNQEESVPIPKLTAEELFYLERDVFSVHESHAAREICARLLVEYREMAEKLALYERAEREQLTLYPSYDDRTGMLRFWSARRWLPGSSPRRTEAATPEAAIRTLFAKLDGKDG